MVVSGSAHAIRTDKGSAMADATEQPQPVSDHPQVPDAPESLAEAVVRTVHHPLLVLTGELVIERSEEHTSELQSLRRISSAVICLKKQTPKQHKQQRSEDTQ